MNNKITIAALIALLLVAGGIYWLNGPQSKVKMAPVAEPELSMAAYMKHDAPQDVAPFTFLDATGTEKDLSSLKGKVTLLNLWATWCAPCRKEMPELSKLQKDLGGDNFQVVEVSEDLKGYQASADGVTGHEMAPFETVPVRSPWPYGRLSWEYGAVR